MRVNGRASCRSALRVVVAFSAHNVATSSAGLASCPELLNGGHADLRVRGSTHRAMTGNRLPAAIQTFTEAANRGDSDAFVTLTVTGDGFNGTGSMNIELRDGRIASLRIS
jgi:hypothetical protein